MPRVVQTLNSSDLSEHLDIPHTNSSTAKMPDSSAGDSPRQQPAKPVRPALPSNRPVVPRALNFGSSDIVLDSDINENSENLEVRPKKIELNSRNFLKPQANSSPSTKPKFTPKSGGLLEAAIEVASNPGNNTPVQRSNKWQKSESSSSSKSPGLVRLDQLKEWQEKGETNIPATNFYNSKRFSFGKASPVTYGSTKSLKNDKNRSTLSEKDINNKINRTNHSTPKTSVGDFRFISIDNDSESDKDKLIDLEPEPTQNILEVALPDKLDPHKIGFQNRGNTCYLNASLQALLGLPMVVTDATNIKYAMAKLAPKIDSSRLVLPFTSLCLAQTRGEVARANRRVQDLKSDMELVDTQFAGNKMQDANEFLCRFMDELKENIEHLYEELGDKSKLVLKDESDTTHTLTNLVDTNFLYEREEQFACCSCGAKSQSRHTDVSFFCDLSQSTLPCVPLQQLVQQSLAPEVREKRCESCGCETATTTTRLVRLPKVLVLYLKRYKYSQSGPAPSRKVTRLVDIPESVNLSRLVSDNVILPSSQLPTTLVKSQPTASQLPPSTPTKSNPLPVPQFGTPIKFKGKTEEELMKLSEDDQTEYLLYISQKEALTSQGRETMFVNEDEDEDLKAALEASLLDVTENSGNIFNSEQKENIDKTNSESVFKTPLRKRHHSLSSPIKEPLPKVGRHCGGVFTHSTESLTMGKGGEGNGGTRRGDTPTPCERNSISAGTPKASEYFKSDGTQSPKADGDNDKTKSWKSSFHRPVTKAEEEADMLRALELSTQDMGCSSDQEDMTDDTRITVEDTGNPTDKEVANDNSSVLEIEPGPPEHSYKLSSVVSHFGASTSAGHYVADVFRFDAGGWFRYDDTVVTQTDQTAVRTGSNRANGYIFMYMHQPLWEECNSDKRREENSCDQ